MTAGEKTGTLLASVLAILTLVMGSQSLPFLQWLFSEAKQVFTLPLFAPLSIAVIVGACAPAWLPYALPSTWPAHRTKRVTRLLGFLIAFSMMVVQYRNAVGVQYGLFAGTGSYVLWTVVSGFVYNHLPRTKPESLEDSAGDA